MQGTGAGAGGHVKLRFFPRAADSRHVRVRGRKEGGVWHVFPRDCSFPQVGPAAGERYPGDATLNPNQDSVKFLFF